MAAKWQTVAKFLNLSEAEVARAALEAAGFTVRLRDVQVGGLQWGYIPALGGLRLEVPDEQTEEALALLGDPSGGEAAPPEETVLLAKTRRRQRLVGMVALLLMLGPVALLLLPFSALGGGTRKARQRP